MNWLEIEFDHGSREITDEIKNSGRRMKERERKKDRTASVSRERLKN